MSITREVTTNKVEKVNYKSEMWARIIGSLFCIINSEKTGLLAEITLPQPLHKTGKFTKRMVFFDDKFSRDVGFFEFSWFLICLLKYGFPT